ncbi:cyanobacterial phytochrome A [Deinococcus koreensis]|uniref:histidine kinase n=1 Tax=Deinococcus koreensis TaxID=2054903 RepID=A0A2K3USR1_9DEIO|nr:cyanobacterial phytochrome A [Deinococcus koreensis]
MGAQVRLGSQTVDLTSCDREPIHIPGYVQPHGFLLVVDEASGRIVQASANAADFVRPGNGGPDQATPDQTTLNQAVLGQPLGALLEPASLEQLASARENLEGNPLHVFTAPLRGTGARFDVIAHRQGGLLLLELEPAPPQAPNPVDFYRLIKTSLAALGAAQSLTEFAQVGAREVRALSGYDRVMIYRFADDGTGQIIAEDKQDALTPFLGLHYPASDIPRQARALYVLNMLRIVGDVNYEPVPLIPTLLPTTGAPTDMSHCVLRSVSPVHVQYLQNMGVGATLTISILRGGELWGLIACHHQTPRRVGYDVRAACEFLGQVMSLQLSAKEEHEEQAYRLRLGHARARLVELMARHDDLIEGLLQSDLDLLAFLDAPGAAVCIGEEVVLLGTTPARAEVLELAGWLAEQHELADNGLIHTDALSDDFGPAQAYQREASGLLAVQVSARRQDLVMWFRPEQVQTVSWGGDPSKPVEVGSAGTGVLAGNEPRLTPRKSFEAWQQTVRGRSVPWRLSELGAAQDLRAAILSVVLRQAEQVGQLNADLSRSNAELDAFAYIASHDLKEPLRGLHNYATFLQESYSERMDAEGQHKLGTLVRLTQRMEDLIDSLLLFSRVGREDLRVQEADLGEVLAGVLEMLQARLEQDRVQVRVPRPLPRLRVDRVRAGEVFNNLISNAIKYTDKPQRWIEIGSLSPAERGPLRVPEGLGESADIFYVRDNGIGIRERHLEGIFRIFKRLHARDQFGGGTGAGLTIARKLVERHGGQLWAHSELGQGSTFYFTLEA